MKMYRNVKGLDIQVYFYFISISTLLISCLDNKDTHSNKSVYLSESYIIGKKIFYDYCTQCHLPKTKDMDFKPFINKLPYEKDQQSKTLSYFFRNNEFHLNNVGKENLSLGQINNLLLFLKTPQKDDVAN